MMDDGGQVVSDGIGYPRKNSTLKTYSQTKDSMDKGYVHKLLKPFISLTWISKWQNKLAIQWT